ncbi:MAG: hypothetical protein QOI41_4339 [Myxococcales bacterium]|nr:hypothetical protein [Myxococcales bacterium]
MNPPPSIPKNRDSFRPLLFAPPQGPDALPKTLPPPAPMRSATPRTRPPARSANDSHVRLRAQSASLPRATDIDYLDADDVLDELCEDQLMLSVNLTCLEELVAAAPPDASARAALRTLAARLADLGALRDALANVQLSIIDPRLQRICVPESPLADYLKGVYAWSHAVVRALDHLAGSLRSQPDWAKLRWRLEEAKNFHFDELHEAIRGDLTALAVVANGGSFGAKRPRVEELQYAVERLISTAVALEAHLDERFG